MKRRAYIRPEIIIYDVQNEYHLLSTSPGNIGTGGSGNADDSDGKTTDFDDDWDESFIFQKSIWEE